MSERRARIPPDELPEADADGQHLRLPEDAAHYVRDVLRMEPGDALELFDGDGRVLDCRLQSVRENTVQVAILDDRESLRNESPTSIALCPAIPKGDRWRWLIEKTTELGVARIHPLETRHTVVEIPDDKLEHKLERWDRIAGEAARQSERTRVPSFTAPTSVERLLDERPFEGIDCVLDARSDSLALAEAIGRARDSSPAPPLRFWIGPEGGFTEAELDQLSDSGALFCHLGPRILRVETAAVAAVTLAQHETGGLDRD